MDKILKLFFTENKNEFLHRYILEQLYFLTALIKIQNKFDEKKYCE